jgi:hypothetical protein
LIAPNRTTVRPARTRRSRIERQYPHRESTGKSPDRERKIASRKNAAAHSLGANFTKINPLFYRHDLQKWIPSTKILPNQKKAS